MSENEQYVLTVNEWVQLALAATTFFAVIVALFGERFWRWLDRPKVTIDFDKTSERCFRWATIENNSVQGEGLFKDVKKYYFRLRVHNNGSTAHSLRVRADIFDKNKKLLERFEPTTLNWINSQESVELAKNESEYVNLISQVVNNPKIRNRLTVEVFSTNPRGIAWDRPLEIYFFEVTVFGDNIKPVQVTFKFTPRRNINKPGILKVV